LDDPGNPEGLLGPIWRTPELAADDRRRWPPRRPIRSLGGGAAGAFERASR
jgi:hypothetical protein